MFSEVLESTFPFVQHYEITDSVSLSASGMHDRELTAICLKIVLMEKRQLHGSQTTDLARPVCAVSHDVDL